MRFGLVSAAIPKALSSNAIECYCSKFREKRIISPKMLKFFDSSRP
jgi:hypothetical protein